MRKLRKIILLIILGSWLVGCNKIDNKLDDNSNSNSNETIEEKVNQKLESLTLDEKIAQMLIVSYRSNSMDDNLKNILETNKPGGFILFSENFTSYDDTLKLINDIKSTADIPMFISIDQEGGKVQRLKELSDIKATVIPSMKKLGDTKDKELAYDVGKVIASELRVFGINMDFAPDVDVIVDDKSFIGDRSFGTSADLVSEMGLSLASGLEDNGVIAVYKHFPGHGSTVVDSHYSLPVINKTKEELLQKDILPFKNAIQNGAKVIMIGHLAIPNLDGNIPASLSKTLITNILKDELNYQGLVVTDALNMGALTKNYSESEIYEMAINAGVDLLLMPKTSTSAIKCIKESIQNNKIKEERIDEAVRKILTLKYEFLNNSELLDKSNLGSNEHQEIIAKIK